MSSRLELDELLSLDDERYWDALRNKGVPLPPVMLAQIPWKEFLHPRGHGGKFRDKPDVLSIARAMGRKPMASDAWMPGDTYTQRLARVGGNAKPEVFDANYDGIDPKLAEKIRTARTADEIAVAMSIKYHNTDFDFSHLNVDTMRDVAAQYARMADEFPEVAAQMRYVGSGQEPENDLYKDGWRGERTTWAYAGKNAVGRGASLHLNPFWFGADTADFHKNLRENVDNGWHAEGGDTPASIVTHEFGHHVDWWITNASSQLGQSHPTLADGTRIDLAHEEFRRELHAHPEQVSDYAKTNPVESFAESFATMYHGPGDLEATRMIKNHLGTVGDLSKWIQPEPVDPESEHLLGNIMRRRTGAKTGRER